MHNNGALHALAIDVLLVDDDPDHRWLTRDALNQSERPCRIHEAGSAEEALTMLVRSDPRHEWGNPDVIYLDIEMPGMSGLALLKRIKGDPILRDIRVVLVTGRKLSVRQKEILRRHGADGVIAKTHDTQNMMRALQRPIRHFAPANPSPWKTR